MDKMQFQRLKKKRAKLDARSSQLDLSLLSRVNLYPIESKEGGKALREAQERQFKQLPYPQAQPWNPGSQLDQVTLIDASTYPVHPIFNLSAARLEDITDVDKYLLSPSGCFAYQNREVSAYCPLKSIPTRSSHLLGLFHCQCLLIWNVQGELDFTSLRL